VFSLALIALMALRLCSGLPALFQNDTLINLALTNIAAQWVMIL